MGAVGAGVLDETQEARVVVDVFQVELIDGVLPVLVLDEGGELGAVEL